MDLPVRTLYQTLLCRFAHELECGELDYELTGSSNFKACNLFQDFKLNCVY